MNRVVCIWSASFDTKLTFSGNAATFKEFVNLQQHHHHHRRRPHVCLCRCHHHHHPHLYKQGLLSSAAGQAVSGYNTIKGARKQQTFRSLLSFI